LYFRTQTLKINFRQAAYQTAGWGRGTIWTNW
jgi:hypothetical protein